MRPIGRGMSGAVERGKDPCVEEGKRSVEEPSGESRPISDSKGDRDSLSKGEHWGRSELSADYSYVLRACLWMLRLALVCVGVWAQPCSLASAIVSNLGHRLKSALSSLGRNTILMHRVK